MAQNLEITKELLRLQEENPELPVRIALPGMAIGTPVSVAVEQYTVIPNPDDPDMHWFAMGVEPEGLVQAFKEDLGIDLSAEQIGSLGWETAIVVRCKPLADAEIAG